MPTHMFMTDAFNRVDLHFYDRRDSRNHKFKRNQRKELKISHCKKIKSYKK